MVDEEGWCLGERHGVGGVSGQRGEAAVLLSASLRFRGGGCSLA